MVFEVEQKPRHSSLKLASFFTKLGISFIATSLLLFILIFYPVVVAELSYILNRPNPDVQVITPIDNEFGIVIPKIGANAHVISDVNPFDEKIYQYALTKGVAHAAGTVYPGGVGNVFLFAHSSVDFYIANRYNSIFYLLNKMKKGDAVYLFYRGKEFKYITTETKIVDANGVKYLYGSGTGNTVTLMTCWPAGTTLKRLLVIGKITEK